MNISKYITLSLIISIPVLGLAQNDSKYGDTPEQQTLCKESLSVYKSYKKQKNYREAYQQWEKACALCPETVQENLYYDGATFIKSEIKAAQKEGDEERSAVLVDSLMWVYDMRMQLYPATKKKPNNRCHVLGRKAADFEKYFKDQPEEAYNMFKECIQCLGGESSATVLMKYYSTGLKTMKKINKVDKQEGEIMKAQLLTDYLMLMEYAEIAMNTNSENAKLVKNYESAISNIQKNFNKIANCEDMVSVLQARIDANPDDLELKSKVLSLLVNRECTDNDLFLPVSTAVYEVEPSAEAAYAIGMGYAKQSNFTESFKYMEEAVMRCDGCPDQVTYLLKAGKIASFLNRPSTAKRYARQVLAKDAGNAEAYILIGDAIAASEKACDDGGLGDSAVYWVAHDYYAKAKRLDSDLADIAENKMSNMEKYFPIIDDVFALGFNAKDSFTVKESGSCPCSSETTIVRVR